MKILNEQAVIAADNLSYEETLLNDFEKSPTEEILRFWESNLYFVVMGIANTAEEEIQGPYCAARKIQILKRCSGGGTVLQGPGCLNYALFLDLQKRPELRTIRSTHHYVLARHAQAIENLLEKKIRHEGDSDLTLHGKKFSGNAMRRKNRFILYHGTFLYDFDFSMIENCLQMPPRRPAYRAGRSHRDFLINLPLKSEQIKQALINVWK